MSDRFTARLPDRYSALRNARIALPSIPSGARGSYTEGPPPGARGATLSGFLAWSIPIATQALNYQERFAAALVQSMKGKGTPGQRKALQGSLACVPLRAA